jgi:cell division protein ZapE
LLDPRTPWQRYQDDLKTEDFLPDQAQAEAVQHIQKLYEKLIDNRQAQPGFMDRLLGRDAASPKGLYFFGGVGRGKTYLMDCFFECLPIEAKRRVHFHRFMEDVHDGLKSQANKADPLVAVGQDLARQAQVLCFDEFFVSDIADAMILGRLLKTLFAEGVTLITTTNIAPDDLYRDGLQRAKFLPAIELLKQHTQVLNVDGGVDYRLRILDRAEIYHQPLDDGAWSSLDRSFHELAPGECVEETVIHVNHREVEAIGVTEGVGWFQFSELCEKPRSATDFIELARRFNTILVSNVPQMKDGSNDPARRFLYLVDEFYDRNVNLIMSAEVPVAEIYVGERLAFEFKRTISRLTEMQTHDYLAQEHKP